MATNRIRRRKLRFLSDLVFSSVFQPVRGASRQPLHAEPHQLGVTFIGHSSFLIQLAGLSILIDPVFARYLYLLKRRRHPGARIHHLPPIDAVLLTHAHMDHLNLPSLRRIVRHTLRLRGIAPVAVVPAGVEDLVATLGFSRVIPLQWWATAELHAFTGSLSPTASQLRSPGDPRSPNTPPLRPPSDTLTPNAPELHPLPPRAPVHLTMTPAQHWGARLFADTHRGYGGYLLSGAGHRLYHSGDTAYFPGFTEIGRRLHPHVALLPIGAYSPDTFRGVHTSPEDALRAFLDLNAATMIPMHYGTFRLSMEPMEEPVPRLLAAAEAAGIRHRILPLTEGQTHLFDPPT